MEIEENYVFKTYDQIAKHFSDTRSYKWPWISNFIENNKGKTILDLGCGNGRNMDYDGCDFIGVDTSQEFVNICRKKNFNCIKSDMCSLCFKDNNFDAIICILRRFFAGENIFKPHSLHLYQRLCKAGWSHSKVSINY